MWRKILIVSAFIATLSFITASCTINYSFTGANLSPDVKTFTVYYFPNRAQLINPNLSQNFTEALKEKLQRQTPLNELTEDGDLEFEGQITGYDFRPMAVQKDDLSSQTRLTITINVKYTNHKVPEDNFETSFSSYEDFDSSLPVSSVEDELTTEIIRKLTEDIFNATIANW